MGFFASRGNRDRKRRPRPAGQRGLARDSDQRGRKRTGASARAVLFCVRHNDRTAQFRAVRAGKRRAVIQVATLQPPHLSARGTRGPNRTRRHHAQRGPAKPAPENRRIQLPNDRPIGHSAREPHRAIGPLRDQHGKKQGTLCAVQSGHRDPDSQVHAPDGRTAGHADGAAGRVQRIDG